MKWFEKIGTAVFVVITLIFFAEMYDIDLKMIEAKAQIVSSCQTYYDKAIKLADESVEPLPPGQTVDFDPRMAKSNSSIAYSQIYKNCKKYME